MRKIWDIPGGIHPPENKHQSLRTPIRFAGIPERLILPLSQHIGAPSEPVVSVGQQVLKGELIAQAKGPVSVALHAPTSGTITAIEDHALPHPSGLSGRCLILTPDGEDRWRSQQPIPDYTQLDRRDLLERIRQAGIAGMGGAGFPSAIKLNPPKSMVLETLIINGTECEPYITADDILMQEQADAVIAGVEILRHLLQPKETLIGIEDNKPLAIEAMRKAAQGHAIEVVVFPTKYPSGGEKQLIQILTGKEVPNGQLPADVGVVVQNVGTTKAIGDAILLDRPLISRITTVTGNACREPQNFEVLLGTPLHFLLEQAGYQRQRSERLIMGGPMMGFALEQFDIPVVKTTNCLLAPDSKEMPAPAPAMPCIRCGMCAEACPASLLPQQLYWFAQGKEWDKLEAHHLFDCIECGACAYSCPSQIPLVQYYRASKAEIRQQKAEQAKSEHAKARFEARQERLAKEQAEKDAKRQARLQNAQSAASTASTDDPIAAAVARAKAKKADAAQDPAQAAIERALAKQQASADQSPREKLQDQLSSLQTRLAKAREKLATAQASGDANLPAFEGSVQKLEEKLRTTEAELAALPPEPAATLDPAQAAIERAKAKQAEMASMSDEEKQREQLVSLEKRLAKAQEKLELARQNHDENLAIFESSCDKLQSKLDELRNQLPAASVTASDPAQAAIERAKAKQAELAQMSPEEQLKDQLASLEKRLAKAREKCELARQTQDDNLAVFESSCEKLEAKLDALRQQHPDVVTTSADTPQDPAQAAIERAKAKQAALAQMSPEDKLRDQVESLEERLIKAEEKRQQAEADGDDNLPVFEATVGKLQQKLDEARQQLAQFGSDQG